MNILLSDRRHRYIDLLYASGTIALEFGKDRHDYEDLDIIHARLEYLANHIKSNDCYKKILHLFEIISQAI